MDENNTTQETNTIENPTQQPQVEEVKDQGMPTGITETLPDTDEENVEFENPRKCS